MARSCSATCTVTLRSSPMPVLIPVFGLVFKLVMHAGTMHLTPDVESMLRKEVRWRGEPFKQVLDNAIRVGLRNMKRRDEVFEPLTFDMGEPRVDLTKAASLAAELEDDELIGRYRRSR